jgi:molecular chaperone HtpG
VIREFVQNAYDGMYDLHKQYPTENLQPIEIKVDPPSIFIGDHGIGMSQKKMQEYRYLGYSEKQRGEHAGFRGIGKYSGLAIAEKIIVDSSRFGSDSRWRVVVHVGDMISEVERRQNPPLEDLLQQFTSLEEFPEDKEKHYTFVELHKIRQDSIEVLDEDAIRDYLSKVAPVPFDTKFKHAVEIEENLAETVSDYFVVPLSINGRDVLKPYLPDCRRPGFETVLFTDKGQEVLAFAWYCQNLQRGQFKDKENSGLVYRVKNIAVGDRHLTRKTLWKATPERAFHFFGEIHVLDPQVIPSADRTDFEDNAARRQLYERCLRISSILSRKAGEESATRRFKEALSNAGSFLQQRQQQFADHQLPVELREEVVFQLKKYQEDIEKRIPGSKSRLKSAGKRFVKSAQRFLSRLQAPSDQFFDLQKELRLSAKMRALYNIVMAVLKEEFRSDPERLERVIRRIQDALTIGHVD